MRLSCDRRAGKMKGIVLAGSIKASMVKTQACFSRPVDLDFYQTLRLWKISFQSKGKLENKTNNTLRKPVNQRRKINK